MTTCPQRKARASLIAGLLQRLGKTRAIEQTTKPNPEQELSLTPWALAQCANLCVETTLISGCLVLVNQAFSRHVIKYRDCVLVGCFRSTLVTACDGSENTLNHGAHHGAMAGITLTRFFGLANAFACLGCVGHELSSTVSILNSAAHYPPVYVPRQWLVV